MTDDEFKKEVLRLFKIHKKVTDKIWKAYSYFPNINYNYYRNKNGGIKRILKDFGVDYKFHSSLTKEEILKRATDLYKTNGFIDKVLCCKNHISSSSVRREFGSYNNLFLEINAPINMNKNITKKDLINDILLFIKKFETTSSTFYRKYGKYSECIINKYGGWESLLKELNITSKRNSSAECLIEKILTEENIEFKIHFGWEWLRNSDGNKMFVDFYLPRYNIVIEYDGEQHYKFVKYFHKTYSNFLKNQERDKEKSLLLNNHNIKLYRILYNDDIISKLNEIIKLLN